MRLFGLAVLFVATTALTGCEKDDVQPEENTVLLTTTVSFLGNEATKALTRDGVKTFANGEQMAVVYENTSNELVKTTVTLESANISLDSKSVSFTVAASNPKPNGTFRLIYPAAMAGTDDVDYSNLANQDGSLTTLAADYDLGYYSSTLDAEGNLPASCQLDNPLVIASFTLKESGTTINSGVTMLFIGDGTNSYYITRAAAADSIWVAMKPMAASTVVSFHAIANGDRYEKESFALPAALVAGHITPIRLSMTKLQDGATFGKFSIDGSNTVHFSQGNLQYDRSTTTWSFMDYQWSTVETSGQNVGDGYANQNIVGLFGWSADGTNNFGISTSTNYSDYSGSFVDWGTNNITNGGGANHWSTPSTDEWQYIFNTRSASTGRFAKAYLSGTTHGMILFPDHYTHPNDVPVPTGINLTDHTSWNGNQYTAEQWAKMEAAGAVFLPAAGGRYGTDVNVFGNLGYYWSSTADDDGYAWNVGFYEGYVDPGYGNDRDLGHSVRLVCE